MGVNHVPTMLLALLTQTDASDSPATKARAPKLKVRLLPLVTETKSLLRR